MIVHFEAAACIEPIGVSQRSHAKDTQDFLKQFCKSFRPSTCQRSWMNSYDSSSHYQSTTKINVNPINDAPVLEGIETTPLVFQENSVPLPVTQTIVITDIDSDTMGGAKVTLVDYEFGIDALAFEQGNSNDIEVVFDGRTGYQKNLQRSESRGD